jgi:hypothetical protein
MLEGHIKELARLLANMVWSMRASLVTTDSKDGLQLTAVWKGVSADEHFHDETAQTPDIGFLGMRRLTHHFWCHPVHTTLHGRPVHVPSAATAGTGSRAENSGCFDALGDTEIGDLDAAFVVDEDVGSLDVSVDDVTAVQIRQTG